MYEICSLNDEELKAAIDLEVVSPNATRADVIHFRQLQRSKVKGSKSKAIGSIRSNYSKNGNYRPALLFEVPDELDNDKALIDLRFIYYIASTIFQNIPGNFKIGATLHEPIRLSQKRKSSQTKTELQVYQEFGRFLELARDAENHSRKVNGKSRLGELQKIVSILGADPDEVEGYDFCLMERLAVAYCVRQKLVSMKELKHRREKYDSSSTALSLLNLKAPKSVATTEILILDDDVSDDSLGTRVRERSTCRE